MKRNEVAERLDRLIKEKVAERSKQAVVVESVQLKEIVLPEKIKEQIEKVQIANQEAERVRYEVQRAKQEAEKELHLQVERLKLEELKHKVEQMLLQLKQKHKLLLIKRLQNHLHHIFYRCNKLKFKVSSMML